MAKLRVTGKRYTRNGMLGISLIVVAAVAIAALIVGFVVLPNYAQVEDYKTPEIIGISIPDNAMISVNADLTTVYAVVRYDNGETKKVPISELVYNGLDVSKEGECKDVILNYGGFTQKVDFNVVPTQLVVEYVAGTGGRIDGTAEQKVIAGGNADTVRAIADEGYYFYEWSDGNPNASRTDKSVSKSMKLIATFKRQSYTVVFYYPDGTTSREQTVLHGEKPTYIPKESEGEMQLYGYKFVGWDKDYSSITQDTNIMPVFEKYAVDFHLDITTDKEGVSLGGAASNTEIYDYYEREEIATVRIAPYSGRKFIGWSIRNTEGNWIDLATNASATSIAVGTGGKTMSFSSSNTDNTDEYVLSFTPPKEGVDDLYVKAHFVFVESTITFSNTLGEIKIGDSGSNAVTLPYGEPIGKYYDVEDLTKLTAVGNTFKGWYIENGATKEDGTPVYVTNDTIFEQNATLVTDWQKNIETVVFLKGSSDYDADFEDEARGYDSTYKGRVVKVRYNDKIADSVQFDYPDITPHKENYTFKGWFLADASYAPTSVAIDRTYVVQKDVVYVVPVFEVNTKSLNVYINGSGTAYAVESVEDIDGTVYEKETPISSGIDMPVISDFKLRFRPSTGYSLVSVVINGDENTGIFAKEGAYYDVDIKALIEQNYVVEAKFSVEEYEIYVVNGTGKAGVVSYNEIGAPDEEKQYIKENGTVTVGYGAGVYFEITPPEHKRILSVTVGGVGRTDIPSDARYYSFAVENCVADVSVTIVYGDVTYTVKLPSDDNANGSIVTDTTGDIKEGDKPSFTVTAKTGYYIKSVRANGTIVDPYALREGYKVIGLKINGEDEYADLKNGDYRVTQMEFIIDGINCDTEFTVEYDKLYYKIKASYTGGVGTVSESFVAYYGDFASVEANTSDGYYIKSYKVTSDAIKDENEYVYNDRTRTGLYTIKSVEADYTIVFTFARATYYATFSIGDNLTVTYDGVTTSDSTYTFASLGSGQNAEFVIKAKEGYRISSISYTKSSSSEQVNEPIGYETTEYSLTLNNIADNYSIAVSAAPIMLDYRVYFLNVDKTQRICINGGEDLASKPDFVTGTLIYGNPLTVTVNPVDGYEVKSDGSFTVNSGDTSSSYTYKPFEGDYVKSDSYGQYTLATERDEFDTEKILGYTLEIRDVKTSVDVYVYLPKKSDDISKKESYTVTVDCCGNGTLSSSAETETVDAGSSVTLTAKSNSGYTLKALTINGASVQADDNGNYEITNVDCDIDAYAVFGEEIYTVRTDVGNNGMVSVDKTTVSAGESLNIKIIAATGYVLDTFELEIGGKPIIPSYTQSAVVEYTLDAKNINGNIVVRAKFAGKQYTFKETHNKEGGSVTGLGTTGESELVYGTYTAIDIVANDGFYIGEITVNGSTYDPASLTNGVIYKDGSNNVKSGTLKLFVSEASDITITFLPKVYGITITDTLGGETLARKGNGAFGKASTLSLSAGDSVTVKLVATAGYHIASIKVDGESIESWREAGIDTNAMSEAVIKIKDSVTDNIIVAVEYALNEYQVKINVTNKSLNFAAYDVTPSAYGTVTIAGREGENGVYDGIAHGSDIKFVLAPRTARGYYISRFEITYGDDSTDNLINNINANGGNLTISGISQDIQSVTVEFKRRTYKFTQSVEADNQGSNFICKATTPIEFFNPYAPSADVVLDNGLYEYGILYRLNVDPGDGYERTTFTIGGEDRMLAVASTSYYTSTISSDLAIVVKYTIKKYQVAMKGNANGTYEIKTYAEGSYSTEIIDPQESKTYETSSGVITVDDEGNIYVTHGTRLKFVAKPDSENGYYVKSYKVNDTSVVTGGADGEKETDTVITSTTVVGVEFAIREYSISVGAVNGGTGLLSSGSVKWDGSVTLRVSLSEGYELTGVSVNGNPNNDAFGAIGSKGLGSYVLANIKENITFTLTIETKKYNVTFSGDYNAVKTIERGGVIVKTLNAVSGVVVNQNVFGKTSWSAFTTDDPSQIDEEGVLPGIRFFDAVTLSLTAPDGYRISSIKIAMDNDGGLETVLVSDASKLSADDGSGKRTYTISSVKGNITLSVKYEIKTYDIEYKQVEGGTYRDTSTTKVSHHELVAFDMDSDFGYYLTSFTINGVQVPVQYSKSDKSDKSYSYSTTHGSTKLEVNNELVNGKEKIVVTPNYEKQSYGVSFYIDSKPIIGGYTDDHLKATIKANRIYYDAVNPGIVTLDLERGYSISNITLYGRPKNEATEQVSLDILDAKASEIGIMLDANVLKILDCHSASGSTLYIYINYTKDTYASSTNMLLAEGSANENKAVYIRESEIPTVSGNKALNFSASYSDGVASGSKHEYGTVATFTAGIHSSAVDKYSFEGYQERINGVWQYVKSGENDITLTSGGSVLTYTVTGDREFRAVYYRVYTITLQVYPEYKYTSGSFISGDPDMMTYRRYATMTATVVHGEAVANNAADNVMPDVVGNTETLKDLDGNEKDGTYTYRVKSGGKLSFRYNDSYMSTNPTNGCSYSVLQKDGTLKAELEYATAGVGTLEDRTVYAYLKNKVYASFLVETVGSRTANEGGIVTYQLNAGTVTSLKENSLSFDAGSKVTITIVPNTNFRFDSIFELLSSSSSDSDYKKFNTVYTPLEDTENGAVKISYYNLKNEVVSDPQNFADIGKVIVTLDNVAENSIFKIRFRKRIAFTRSVALITDEGDSPKDYLGLGYLPGTSEEGTYDYGDTVNLQIFDGLDDTDWNRRYQFVGYFINGVNAYTQLGQNYPSSNKYDDYIQSFILDNLSGYANGVNIAEASNKNKEGAYKVDIVARFVPVYNVVIENEYLAGENEYLDAGQVAVTAVMYDSTLPTYYANSVIAEPKTSEANTDVSFTMLGKLNSISLSDKTSATSAYNTWSDNTITLNWIGTTGSGFRFVTWQYLAYDKNTNEAEWKDIPYVDPKSQTNLVTKSTFTFPISALYSTSYMAYLNEDGTGPDKTEFTASVYDNDGTRTGEREIYAIRIRPMYRKVEKITLVQSVAVNEANKFNDGIGDVEPRIAGTGLSEGEFDYDTVQRLLPSTIDGYKFEGWYIGENGEGGRTSLNVVANKDDSDYSVNGVYFKLVKDKIADEETGTSIYCSYDEESGELKIIAKDSYKIFARYTSVYTMNFRVTNVSGYSELLTDTLPNLLVYEADADGNFGEEPKYEGRSVQITDVAVGTKFKVMLSTGYRGDINDPVYFNPVFDRWVGIESVNSNNSDVWGTDSANSGTHMPTFKEKSEYETMTDWAAAYNDELGAAQAIIGATDNKTVTFKFRTYGRLEFHNVYPGASLQLPASLAKAIIDGYGDSAIYFVNDDDGDGEIIIEDIPIEQGVTYDGSVSGDYAIKLISSMASMANGNVNYGINFDGSYVTSKVQHVVYYDTATYNVYEWVKDELKETDVLKKTDVTGTSDMSYPFASSDGKYGDGSAENPFYIETLDHLRSIDNMYIGNECNLTYTKDNQTQKVYFKQIAEIDLGDVSDSLSSPLCAQGNGFNAVYDGNGNLLKNLSLSASGDYVGLFARISNAEVYNLRIGDTLISASASSYVGALAGGISDSKIGNITLEGTSSKNIVGSNYVGALAGETNGTSIYNVKVSGYTIRAIAGASYNGVYFGGAGGIVGALGSGSTITNSLTETVTVISPYAAGGIVGSVLENGDAVSVESVSNCTATDPNLTTGNLAAIGGIAGSVAKNSNIVESTVKFTRDATMVSQSVYGNLTVDDNFMYSSYGVGGIVGFNAGNVASCSLEAPATYRLTFKGTISGGIVGVNLGSVSGATLSSRIYASREKGNAYEGGMYGGIVGYNHGTGTITGSTVSSPIAASNDYTISTALIEVVTLGASYYTPTSGGNGPMHDTLSADNSTIYVGGIVAYNKGGSVENNVYSGNNSKIMVNRRSNNANANTTYIGAVAGYSTTDKIGNTTSSSAAVYIKFLHYLYVDLSSGATAQTVNLNMGAASGNGVGSSNMTVNGTAEYIGGGTKYTPKSKEFFKTGTFYASGYSSGSAQVKFYGLTSQSASSYVTTDWNNEGAIKDGKSSGKVYASDCVEDVYNTFTHIWTYSGALRYVNVSVG